MIDSQLVVIDSQSASSDGQLVVIDSQSASSDTGKLVVVMKESNCFLPVM